MTEQRAKTGTPSHEPGRVDSAVTTGDSAVFSSLIEPYRRELHLHCYRLLGSLQDSEDLVQETILRAWQHFDTFKGHAPIRTWLYTIATNVCLDTLKKRRPRTLPAAASPPMNPLTPIAQAPAESICLEPFPDLWLAEVTDNPEARYSRQESVSLAFLTVLQLLPPRQRAILLLSDVLDWRASEVAHLLSTSVSAGICRPSSRRTSRLLSGLRYSSRHHRGFDSDQAHHRYNDLHCPIARHLFRLPPRTDSVNQVTFEGMCQNWVVLQREY